MAIFPFFFILRLVGRENVFYSLGKCVYDILQPKKPFLGYKNKKFKKSKTWDFSKGVSPWFWVKNWSFFHFIFSGLVGQEKCLLRNSKTRKNLFRLLKKKKIWENWNFSERVRPWFSSEIGHFSIFFLGLAGKENVFYTPGKCVYDILEPQKAFLSYKNKHFKQSKNWDFSKGVSQILTKTMD